MLGSDKMLENASQIWNIIGVSINCLMAYFNFKTICEMKRQREDSFRPYLALLGETPYVKVPKDFQQEFQLENSEKYIWLDIKNVGLKFAKNIKIDSKISQEILNLYNNYSDKEIQNNHSFIKISTCSSVSLMTTSICEEKDILDVNEKCYFLFSNHLLRVIVTILNECFKKKLDKMDDLENIPLLEINISYEDIFCYKYISCYKVILANFYSLPLKDFGYKVIVLKDNEKNN